MTATSAAVVASLGIVALCAGRCYDAPVLTRQVEARRLVADLRLQLDTAAGASSQAVEAPTVEAAAAATRQSEEAAQAVEGKAQALRPILESLRPWADRRARARRR